MKATYVSLAVFWEWARGRDLISWLYLKWVAAAAQADLLFALGAGLLATAFLWLLRKTRGSWFVYWGFIAFALVSIWYAIVSRQFFSYAAAPLTYQLFALGGDPRQLGSSLAPYLTAPVMAALIGAPLLYLALVWISQRPRATPPRALVRNRAIIGVGVGLWLWLGRELLGSGWFEAQDRHIAESPHWVLSQSVLLQVAGARSSLGSIAVRKGDLCEFVHAPGASKGSTGPVPGTEKGRRPRNVILIVLESVGAQFLSIYGSPFGTTPRLAAEQTSSLVFDSYYAPVGWTAYSLYAIANSQRPPIRGYTSASFTLSDTLRNSLANVLSSRGYRTAFMSSGNPEWASKGFFEGRGFGEVVQNRALPGAKQLTSWGVPDHFVFDGIIEWVQQHAQEPFFLMAWTDQSHHPYRLAPGQELLPSLPVEMQDSTKEFSRYLTLVHAADREIGRLLDSLRARGLADNTLVVVTGDHGEAFGKVHAGLGHGFTVYDEEVRVPLVLWNPLLFKGGKRSAEVGSHIDLNATILDVLGVPPPSEWDGGSLLSRTRPVPTFLFAAGWGESLIGVRDERWKYVFDARRGQDELYDLVTDPNEQTNLVRSQGDQVAREKERLAAWLRFNRDGSSHVAATCE